VIIVEGAGGLFTPLGKAEAGKGGATMADLAGFLDIPLVIVAPSRIGVINQCLLTVRAARSKGLPLMGIVLNHPAPPDPGDHSLDSNMKEVAGHTGEEILGEIPYYAKKNTPYVDVRGIIKRFLGAL
jgi:dethiobiotin synthetase